MVPKPCCICDNLSLVLSTGYCGCHLQEGLQQVACHLSVCGHLTSGAGGFAMCLSGSPLALLMLQAFVGMSWFDWFDYMQDTPCHPLSYLLSADLLQQACIESSHKYVQVCNNSLMRQHAHS
jgi:hypothetical protein